MRPHEDQVIAVVATSLRKQGVAVLAEGANQMRAFRFVLQSGRRKAPDLVFALADTLFIFEAKVLASDLFKTTADGLSDYDAMVEVASSEKIKHELLCEGTRRLASCGRGDEQVVRVTAGLLAGNSLNSLVMRQSQLEALCADVERGRWVVEVSNVGDVLSSRC